MGFIGRFDVAAHVSSSFRGKPQQPFLWALVSPRSHSLHSATDRSHSSYAGTLVCAFDPEAMAARTCASRLPKPIGNSDHLLDGAVNSWWRRRAILCLARWRCLARMAPSIIYATDRSLLSSTVCIVQRPHVFRELPAFALVIGPPVEGESESEA